MIEEGGYHVRKGFRFIDDYVGCYVFSLSEIALRINNTRGIAAPSICFTGASELNEALDGEDENHNLMASADTDGSGKLLMGNFAQPRRGSTAAGGAPDHRLLILHDDDVSGQ